MPAYADCEPREPFGSAYGIRTRVTAVRGRRPGPLDECAGSAGDAEDSLWASSRSRSGNAVRADGIPCAALRHLLRDHYPAERGAGADGVERVAGDQGQSRAGVLA